MAAFPYLKIDVIYACANAEDERYRAVNFVGLPSRGDVITFVDDDGDEYDGVVSKITWREVRGQRTSAFRPTVWVAQQ